MDMLVICNSRNPNLTFQIQAFEKLGLGLDIAGRTYWMNHRRIYTLCRAPQSFWAPEATPMHMHVEISYKDIAQLTSGAAYK